MSSNGKKYIICFVCTSSKWVEAVATSSISAKQVAKAFLEIVARIGHPKVLISDQGTHFTSELMAKLCELMGTEQRFSVAYHSESHGAVEKVNQTLVKMLKSYVQESRESLGRGVALYSVRIQIDPT